MHQSRFPKNKQLCWGLTFFDKPQLSANHVNLYRLVIAIRLEQNKQESIMSQLLAGVPPLQGKYIYKRTTNEFFFNSKIPYASNSRSTTWIPSWLYFNFDYWIKHLIQRSCKLLIAYVLIYRINIYRNFYYWIKLTESGITEINFTYNGRHVW
jgi:hypothetical protein